MTDSQIDQRVLTVLNGQAPDYLIHPDAAAFVAEGFDADTVAASLARLETAGTARQDEIVAMRYATETLLDENGDPILNEANEPIVQAKIDPATGQQVLEPMLDDNGNEVTVAAGWCITDSGKAAVQ